MNKNEVIVTWEKELPRLESAFVNFNWENTSSYACYLAQTFRYITHSCLLLKYAATKTQNESLIKCLLHHDQEEDGHEQLALNDLKKLGFNLEQLPELETTKQIYASIYKQIDQYGPAAIVGYALALEGVSARRCPEIADRLTKQYGANKSTLIRLHGNVDPDHIKESFDVLNHFEDNDLQIICQVIVESIDRYIEYLAELEKTASEMIAFIEPQKLHA